MDIAQGYKQPSLKTKGYINKKARKPSSAQQIFAFVAFNLNYLKHLKIKKIKIDHFSAADYQELLKQRIIEKLP